MVDANTLLQFEQMVGALMSPDNNVRGQAEAAFNQAKSNPDVLMSGLVHLLRHNQAEQVERSLRHPENSLPAACTRATLDIEQRRWKPGRCARVAPLA